MRTAWLVPLVLSGCGLTTHVRPVPADTLQLEGAIGGPLLESWGAPLPDATVGVRYGAGPGWDLGAHLDVSSLVVAAFGLSVEANVLAVEQHGGLPALAIGGRGYVYSGGGAMLGADLGATASWLVVPQWMLFAGAGWHVQTLVGLPVWTLAAGTRLQAGAFGVQAELRWHDLAPLIVGGNTLTWISPFGRGAIGLVVGVDYQIGFSSPPERTPSAPAP